MNPAVGEMLATYEPLAEEALEEELARAAAGFMDAQTGWIGGRSSQQAEGSTAGAAAE